ncbi:Wings apart-like protein [Corchorus olitorius]|uniref:Wings apart-like protein n=1 Tax=Corchorus olitorius TaxID=93759 RepID=A0A1R3H473_9ROSI|nr:Wings apart-like protein [Corchorus olitorius]
MIVRTYGRRNRGLNRTFSDSQDDDVSDSPPLSQETAASQDIYSFPFNSQESSSFWPSSQEFNDDVYKNQITTVKRTHSEFEFDDSRNGGVRRSKKQKKNHSKKEVGYSSIPWISPTSTLMEAQEFGEMMEHVDEVNFALDGLKKGQPVRIRRASLLSLLSSCATTQQRRLLRSHGMAKTIVDAILGLNFDDTPSNLAAVALFYVLTSDGQDEHLLESPACIRFLIKLLKPVIPTAKENKIGKVGFKLLALRKDADISRDTSKVLDSSSAAIISKVEEILVSCKEMKPRCGDDSGLRSELNPKWVALLTLEKACLSKISLEDTTGTVRKTGGNFKEKLREHGGLYAVFEVALECHSVMEGLVKQSSSSPLIEDKKDVESLVLLSKCLKIMENAAFLSSDNQSHLLELKGQLNSHGSRVSFTKLVISVIKILSGLYLKSSSALSSTQKACSNSKALDEADELARIADSKVDGHDVIYISSSEKSSSLDWSFSEKSFNTSQNDPGPSTQWLGPPASSFQTTTRSTNDNCLLKTRVHSSLSSSCSGKLGSSYDGLPVTSNRLGSLSEKPDGPKVGKWQLLEDSRDPYAFDEEDSQDPKAGKWKLGSSYDGIPVTSNRLGSLSEKPDGPKAGKLQLLEDSRDPYAFDEEDSQDPKAGKWKLGSSYDGIPVTSNRLGSLSVKPDGLKAGKWQLLEDSQDPYAFDEDDFVPSKWDLLSGKQKTSRSKKRGKVGLSNGEIQDDHQYQFTMSQQESSNGNIFQTEFINEEYHHSSATSGSQSAEEEYSNLLSDCLLTAVKVLMNLTNDNPLGCQQIASSGALETLATLIASHFPSFCSYLPPLSSEMEENSFSVELQDRPLTDPELDFLVAILGLLVNLVEKDEHNRSRLAAASVSLPSSDGLGKESQMAVIPLLCAIFLANQGEDDAAGEVLPWNDEAALLHEEKEAEKMILEAYAALLLAFLSTESLKTLVPVLERFVAFHFTLNMISPETHKAVSEVIESCRLP